MITNDFFSNENNLQVYTLVHPSFPVPVSGRALSSAAR